MGEYSDDEEKIYFTEKQLIQHLFRLEETNLFDVNQLGNDEQQLDEVTKSSQESLVQMRKKVTEIDEGIQ